MNTISRRTFARCTGLHPRRVDTAKSGVFGRCAAALLLTALSAPAMAKAPPQPVGVSLTGAVTTDEIARFKSAAGQFEPPVNGGGNVWVYGTPGKAIEACGLMYEVSRDRQILDRMVYFCDAALAGRNDLLPAKDGGQRRIWTGAVDPVWPSDRGGSAPAGAAVEQGQVLSHIAYCIRCILQTPALADQVVPDHDPHHFGATYRQRAATYLRQCDHVIDAWILPRFIRAADHNRYYFPGAPNTYKPGEPAPWNQAWMLTNGLVRLTECHLLRGDDAQRVSRYDSIVKPNIAWFLESAKPQTSPAGSECRTWAYSLAQPSTIEDTNHAAYDSEGLWIAYASGRYGLKAADLLPFANTYVDIVLATVRDGRFAGRVDGTTGTGHRGGDDYVRDEYLYLAEFRPDAFAQMGAAEIKSGQVDRSLPILARLLWEKDRRAKGVVGTTDAAGARFSNAAVPTDH